MKPNDIRDWTTEEAEQKLSELREEIFNLRFQHGLGHLENPRKIRQTKRDIARIETILTETAGK